MPNKITQKEIDNAPDWATHYRFCEDHPRLVCYESELLYQFEHQTQASVNKYGLNVESTQIPGRENSYRPKLAYTKKKDAIAMARYHKLTHKDLR